MMDFLKKNYLLIFILLIATALRFIKLGSFPVGFNDDEAAFGYNAFSILKTARDEWGRLLPFPVFESFGDWKLVLYLYLTVVSQFFFGLNEFATRFPSALFGVFAVFATYLLSKRLFDKRVALIATLLLAISPWHIVASRNAFESDVLVFFIIISTYFFLIGLNSKKFITLSFLGFVISFYIYRSSWIFLPLFILVLFYTFRKQFKIPRFYLIKNLIVALILLLPLIPTTLTFKGQSRFLQESFIAGVARAGINNDINERRGVCKNHLPNIFCISIYNKFLTFASTYVSNYAQNLSFKTYFDKANPSGFQSFATRSVFYLFELPFLILGIYLILKQKNPALKILIPWLLFAPIGASFAGSGNYGRINLIMPSFQIVTAFGIYFFISSLESKFFKNIFVVVLTIVILGSIIKLLSDTFFIDPYFTSRFQRYGYKQLFNYIKSNEDKYDSIVISKKIDYSHQYIQYLYFSKVDPNFYFNNVSRYRGTGGWIILDRIGKYHFVTSIPGLESMPKKTLVVAGEKEVNFPIEPSLIINDLKGDRLFEIYDVDQIKQKLDYEKRN